MAYESLAALDALQSGVNTIAGAAVGVQYAQSVGNQIAALFCSDDSGCPQNWWTLNGSYLQGIIPGVTYAEWVYLIMEDGPGYADANGIYAGEDPYDGLAGEWFLALQGAYQDFQTGISALQNLPDSPCPGIGGYSSFSAVASSMIAVAETAMGYVEQLVVMGSGYNNYAGQPTPSFDFVTQAATDAYNTCITIAGANWQACQADYDGTLNTYYGPSAAVGVGDGGDGDSVPGSPNDYSTN